MQLSAKVGKSAVIKQLKTGPFGLNEEEKRTLMVGVLPFKIPKKFSYLKCNW